jgi:hypothetical protein
MVNPELWTLGPRTATEEYKIKRHTCQKKRVQGSKAQGSGFCIPLDLLTIVKIMGLAKYLQAVQTVLRSRFGTLNGSNARVQYFPTLNAEPRTFEPQVYIFVINIGQLLSSAPNKIDIMDISL